MWRKSTCAPWFTVFLPCLVSCLPLLISCATLVPFHPRWLCPSVALCVIFWGVFLSWLWSSRQEGPRLQMWAVPAAAGTEQHIVLGVLSSSGCNLSQSSAITEPDCLLSLHSNEPALSDPYAPSITLVFLHHYELHIHCILVKIFRNACLLVCVRVFFYLF